MILCDTGPMVALINAKDEDHARCVDVLAQLSRPLLTTWPCVTEAMYLLWQYGGFPAQNELWGYLEDGLIELHLSSLEERQRMRTLMRQYKDRPMDLADASLVAAAEALHQRRIFTLDDDFYIYRYSNRGVFEVAP